ncbi:tripartite motif-containing protein 42-like [Saccostrea echinata]|uniref:tripartite motif-containing protein 42-like n=1 Tax=Saccostrea echinata TaxID=191078 RepID=UPI002A81A318|nr:tripartite motif-containing protein 42-like [Saccostrea echinata]
MLTDTHNDQNIRAQDLILCDLCKTEMVQVQCDTCNMKLCNACIGKHMAADESKEKHEIVRFIFRKSIPLYPKCTSHDNGRCQMYCSQCEVPVCITCIVSDHHLGHKISDILKTLNERKEKIIKKQKELNDTILPTYQDISVDVKDTIKQLENGFLDLSTTITKYGDDWHRKIDQAVEQHQAEIGEMKTKQISTLKNHLDNIHKKISEIQIEITSSEFDFDTQDISELFSIKLNADIFKKLPQKIISYLPTFTPGSSRIQEEDFLSKFGSLSSGKSISEEHGYCIKTTQKSSEAGSFHPVKQLLDEPETISTINTKNRSHLGNVACLNNEEIWIRGNENTLKLFSINHGSLLKSFITKSRNNPFDISVIKQGHVIYTDPKEKTVNIVKNEKIDAVITLQNWKPRNICSTSSGDLLVVVTRKDIKQTKVVRYSGFEEKQTIQFDDDDKPLYSYGVA